MFSTEERRLKRTLMVINAFDDAQRKSIEFENRLWLRENVAKYKISVCIENSMVSELESIHKYLNSKGSFIVQNGKEFPVEEMASKLNAKREAIICWKVKDNEYNYVAFLYRPKA